MAWHISLTLPWQDFSQYSGTFLDFCERALVPSTHIRVPRECMHSTLYAFVKINSFEAPRYLSMRAAALEILRAFREDQIESRLRGLPAFTVRPLKVKHSLAGSTIQFSEASELAELRERVYQAFNATICGKLKSEFEKIGFESYKPDNDKNMGSKLWGSIARNPCAIQTDQLQSEHDLSPKLQSLSLRAVKALLTVSDDAFTNHREADDSLTIKLT